MKTIYINDMHWVTEWSCFIIDLTWLEYFSANNEDDSGDENSDEI